MPEKLASRITYLGISLGACVELTPIPSEARPVEMMQEISKSVIEVLKNSISLEKNHPWILQVFAMRENNLSSSIQRLNDNDSTINHIRFIESGSNVQ